MIGIYKITNLINQKCYIGQSTHVSQRLQRHKSLAFYESGDKYYNHLYCSIRKYGLENFSFEVIEECTKDKLNEREIYWIKFYDATNPEKGYNTSFGGQGSITPFKVKEDMLKQIILDLKFSHLTINDIAKKYSLHSNTITNINQGHCWRQESEDYPLRKPLKKELFFCAKCGKEISRSATYCLECYHLLQRGLNKPTREELKNLIRIKPFTQIGIQYNVTDNAVRKWCDAENLPRTKKEIKSYSDDEWQKI